MNRIIIPTGYMGSGSSAITDLIGEFDGYKSLTGSFEYVFLHCPDGVFDLEDKLLIGNNALRSDEAIHKFEECMNDLFHRKFWWVANYKKYLHPDFMKETEKYIDNLVQYYPSGYWYLQQKYSVSGVLWMGFRKLLLLGRRDKSKLKLPLQWPQMKISLITPKEFYRITQEYLKAVFECMGLHETNLVLDQLLLPYNLWRMEHYFGDNAECFVVERDPRDVFVLNKYLWSKRDEAIPYPTDVEEYCEYYNRLRVMERKTQNPHVHRIFFEDLIYHYEESLQAIYHILSVKPVDHIRKYKFFDPRISINNTQLFLGKRYCEEVKIIERNLTRYLYDFPYSKKFDLDKAF